jgi:hypothetical protein
MANLTQHAKTRMQQRGIPESALECLLDYGRFQYDHRGAAIVFLDKAARRRLAREQGSQPLRQLEKHLDAYAVVGIDGTVKTVGHRYKRIPRP